MSQPRSPLTLDLDRRTAPALVRVAPLGPLPVIPAVRDRRAAYDRSCLAATGLEGRAADQGWRR